MKQLLSVIFLSLVLATATLAQITIRRADFPVSTVRLDSASYRILSKVGLNGQLATGNNQTWDFSTAQDSIAVPVSKYYFTPAALLGPVPTIFSDANLVRNFLGQFQIFSLPARIYERLDSTGLYELGYADDGGKASLVTYTGNATDSIYFPATAVRYDRSLPQQKFPMTANSVWNTLNDRAVTADFQLSIAAAGFNRTPGERVTINDFRDSIVGWGTLRMRNPTGGAPLNFAVLLQRTYDVYVDSFYIAGRPAPTPLLAAFGLVQGATTTSNTTFHFRAVGFSESPITLTVSPSGPSGGYTYTRAVNLAQGLSTANREYDNTPIATKAYPNPSNSDITLTFEKNKDATWSVMVYNLAGQVITTQPISGGKGAINQTISLGNNLPDGTYFYNLIDQNALIRANGQFKLVK